VAWIIGLGPKRQLTFVEDGGPTQVGQVCSCGLGLVRAIYLFLNFLYLISQSCVFSRIMCLFINSCVFYIVVCLFIKCCVFS
jgi:hypothetical protein